MQSESCRWARRFLSLLLAGSTLVSLNAQELTRSQDLPDSPGALVAQNGTPQSQESSGQATAPASPAASGQQAPAADQAQASPQNSTQAAQPAQSQTTPAQSSQPSRPAGTAVAETPSTTGVAASNPAGAAIAPAKPHRVRIFLISLGAIAGAGVALGAVAALSSASPSRPPGAR